MKGHDSVRVALSRVVDPVETRAGMRDSRLERLLPPILVEKGLNAGTQDAGT